MATIARSRFLLYRYVLNVSNGLFAADTTRVIQSPPAAQLLSWRCPMLWIRVRFSGGLPLLHQLSTSLSIESASCLVS